VEHAKPTLVLAALGGVAGVSSFHPSMDQAICAFLLSGVAALVLFGLGRWVLWEYLERRECRRPVHLAYPHKPIEKEPIGD
jgi:hypothetical protein